MNLRVLGCSGSESPHDRPASFLIDRKILLDAGSAAATLSLDEQAGIDHVLLSHPHLDHVKDLAFLAENVLSRREHPIRVHGSMDCLRKLHLHLFNNIIWPDFTRIPDPDRPVLVFEPLPEGGSLILDGLEIVPVPVEHPGGCISYFLRSERSSLAYTGDTGDTGSFWDRAGKTADLSALIVETSFPDELEELAEVSGHLTPRRLSAGLRRAALGDVPIHICHIKIEGRDRVLAQLKAMADPRIRILHPGVIIDF